MAGAVAHSVLHGFNPDTPTEQPVSQVQLIAFMRMYDTPNSQLEAIITNTSAAQQRVIQETAAATMEHRGAIEKVHEDVQRLAARLAEDIANSVTGYKTELEDRLEMAFTDIATNRRPGEGVRGD